MLHARNILGKVAAAALLVFIVYQCISAICYYAERPTLWLDECTLALTPVEKSWTELFDPQFAHKQSASLGYVLLVKLFVETIPALEVSLRMTSLLAFFLLIPMVYLVGRVTMRLGHFISLLAATLVASSSYLIRYSAEAKPYMFDLLVIMVVFLMMGYWQKERIATWCLGIIYAFLIWFSYSSIFAIAACCLLVTIKILREHVPYKRKLIRLMGLLSVPISAALCYFVWISPQASAASSMAYWTKLCFPLIPTSTEELELARQMTYHLVRVWNPILQPARFTADLIWLVAITVTAGVVCIVRRQNLGYAAVFLLILFTLSASYAGKYPIQDRLVFYIGICWLYLVLCILAALLRVVPAKMVANPYVRGVAQMATAALVIWAAIDLSKESRRQLGGFNSSMDSVKCAMTLVSRKGNDVALFVDQRTVPIFDCLIHACDPKIQTKLRNGSLIKGENVLIRDDSQAYRTVFRIDQKMLDYNVDRILEYPKTYLLASHKNQDSMPSLREALRSKGTLTCILHDGAVQLYLFEKSPKVTP